MTCAEFVDFLMSYLDDEIPAAQRKTFEGHIGDCPPCEVYLDQYRRRSRRHRPPLGGIALDASLAAAFACVYIACTGSACAPGFSP